jgi:acetoin utilization deacetylase AcuC-like enzyme
VPHDPGPSRLSHPVLYFHHPTSLEPDPQSLIPEHPDVPERIEAIERAMATAQWLGCECRQSPAVDEARLELVHTAEHVRHIAGLADSGPAEIDDDTVVTSQSYRAALHAAGAACAMVEALVAGEAEAGFCGLRPAGHHADRDRAMGFCLFNNVAVAAQLAIAKLGVERVLIVDWDVHHGNGTAEIFRRRRDVLYASIHQGDLFPGTGKITDAGSGDGHGYTLNLPVPSGATDEVWLSLVEYVVIPVALEFAPQLILISAGFDAHRDDPLGGCLLDSDSFAQLACHVRDAGRTLAAPVGAVLEGGYDLQALAASTVATVAALSGDGEAESIAPDPLITSRASAHVSHFWEL